MLQLEYAITLAPEVLTALSIQGITEPQIVGAQKLPNDIALTGYFAFSDADGNWYENCDSANLIAAIELAGFTVLGATPTRDHLGTGEDLLAVRFQWTIVLSDLYGQK